MWRCGHDTSPSATADRAIATLSSSVRVTVVEPPGRMCVTGSNPPLPIASRPVEA
jgi:hypothetical protein